MINQFNLVDEPWIPIADHEKVSLKQLFAQYGYKALGGNPIQKIALFKLLFAISQAAATPKDELEWRTMSTQQLAEKCIAYLDKWYDSFYLYGSHPFLQMSNINKAKVVPFGVVLPQIATGNTTVLTQSQVDKPLDNADKALLLLTLMGFALGGKKTDNSVVLTPNYSGKSNDKGKPSTSKPGPSVGHMGFLHNIIVAETVLDTLWINLFTEAKLKEINLFPNLLGMAPWERMPEGEDCLVAQDLQQSYMGRLLPLARFCLLTDNGLHYSEGIAHANYKEGQPDLTIAVNYTGKDPKVLWTNPDKRPWRDLTSLLSFIVQSQAQGFQCWQIQNSVSRVRDHLKIFSIWSGGLSVSSNAGEQYVSGSNDFVESQFWLYSDELGESWYLRLKQEITNLDQLAKNLYGRVMAFYKDQMVDGANMAALASSLFWQLCERDFQYLLNCCGEGDRMRSECKKLRMKFANYQLKAYDKYCPNETARQLDAWARNKPNNFKYGRSIVMDEIAISEEAVPKKISREQKFVERVIMYCQKDKGIAAKLKRAENPSMEYQSWEVLGGLIDLENEFERIPSVLISAAIAKSKVEKNGILPLGEAIAACYLDGNNDQQAKARLRRLLACHDIAEASRILRPILTLIDSRVTLGHLDFVRLLKQLRYFSDRSKIQWASEFYGTSLQKGETE